MNFLKFNSLVLATLILFGCGSDESDDQVITTPEIESCKLISVFDQQDPTTAFGLFDVAYNDDGSLKTAGLQDYDFSYDTDGKLNEARLSETSFNPEVAFVYTYAGDQLTQIVERWGVDPNIEDRYVYTITYDANGFVNSMTKTGLGSTSELMYEFDANGNPLKWTEPSFLDIKEYTFSTDDGIFTELNHTLAFAYSVAISQPHFLFSNAITSEKLSDFNGNEYESSTFTDITFNELGLQTKAGDPNGKTYVYEYECE